MAVPAAISRPGPRATTRSTPRSSPRSRPEKEGEEGRGGPTAAAPYIVGRGRRGRVIRAAKKACARACCGRAARPLWREAGVRTSLAGFGAKRACFRFHTCRACLCANVVGVRTRKVFAHTRKAGVRARKAGSCTKQAGFRTRKAFCRFLYKGMGCSYEPDRVLYGDGRCSYKEGGFPYEGDGRSC